MTQHTELIERLRWIDGVTCNAAADALEAQAMEIERLRKDAERYRGFVEIMESAKGSADLVVNDHLCYYETCEPGEEVHLQWFPDTSVGSYTIKGRTIDEVVDAAIAMKGQP